MHGKGGQVCSESKSGRIKCPLIVRPTSEDQITGEIFQLLRFIDPRHWVNAVLNEALEANRFNRYIFQKFAIELWANHPRFPRNLSLWPEGSTQVDAVIQWSSPRTVVFVEMKFGSPLSSRVSADDGQSGFPSDQLIRNIRVGLWQCGWFSRSSMLRKTPIDFIVLVVSPSQDQPLVEKYRDRDVVMGSIANSAELVGLPESPFVGSISFSQIAETLRRRIRYMDRIQGKIANDIAEYLTFKSKQLAIFTQSRSRTQKALQFEVADEQNSTVQTSALI